MFPLVKMYKKWSKTWFRQEKSKAHNVTYWSKNQSPWSTIKLTTPWSMVKGFPGQWEMVKVIVGQWLKSPRIQVTTRIVGSKTPLQL